MFRLNVRAGCLRFTIKISIFGRFLFQSSGHQEREVLTKPNCSWADLVTEIDVQKLLYSRDSGQQQPSNTLEDRMKRSVVLYCPLCFFLPMVILLYIFVEVNLDVRNAEEKFDLGTSRHSPSSLDAEGQLRTAQKSGGQQGQGLDLGQGQSQKKITFPPFVEEINEIGE